MPTLKIVFVGDSNTAYVAYPYGNLPVLFQSSQQATFPSLTVTVVNRAVGATAMDHALTDIANVLAENPHIIVLAHGGTNDSYFDDGVATYEARLQSYINQVAAYDNGSAQNGGVPLLVFVTAPAIAEEIDGWLYYRDRTKLVEYMAAFSAIAADNYLPLVDWFTECLLNPSWQADYLVDGVHVNTACKNVVVPLLSSAIMPLQEADGTIVSAAVGIGTITETTASGWRSAGVTVAVTCPTATVGTVTYPTATTWAAPISGWTVGENILTTTVATLYGNFTDAAAYEHTPVFAPLFFRKITPDGLRFMPGFVRTATGQNKAVWQVRTE